MAAAGSGGTEMARFNFLRRLWISYRSAIPEPKRYMQLKADLKQVRNAGWNSNPSLSIWPPYLIDPDDAVMAAVEHYFLCRAWVGNGIYPAWQVDAMSIAYDIGKTLGITPRHNPDKPVTPLTLLQMSAKIAGVTDGQADLKAAKSSSPIVAMPPTY